MIDVYGHFAVLDVLRWQLQQSITSAAITDQKVIDAGSALEDHFSYAVLGAITDHLLAHDKEADEELRLLDNLLTIGRGIIKMLEDFRKIRESVEAVVINSADPDALDKCNDALQAFAELVPRYEKLVADLQDFGQQVFPLSYLQPHGITADKPPKGWGWKDLMLSRGTGAFAAAIMDSARLKDDKAMAFAIGVLSGHIGNTVGSPFLLHVTGGPRRSHPYRNRLAGYATGAWIRHFPLPVPDRTTHIPVFGTAAAPQLPAWIETMLSEALDTVYGGKGPDILPDLQRAYQQLIAHWAMLNEIKPFPEVKPVHTTLRQQLITQLNPADRDRDDGFPEGARTDNPTHEEDGPIESLLFTPQGGLPWFNPTHENVVDWIKEICLHLLFPPISITRFASYFYHELNEPDPQDHREAGRRMGTRLTAAEFQTIISGKGHLTAIDVLFNMDMELSGVSWEALQLMKYAGLLYPELIELQEIIFNQFNVIPHGDLKFKWPATPLTNPENYLALPASPLEAPMNPPSGFAYGEKPVAFLFKGVGDAPAADNFGFNLLVDELRQSPASAIRSENINLDGDRGYDHLCWETAAGTSIHDNPLQIRVLNYLEI